MVVALWDADVTMERKASWIEDYTYKGQLSRRHLVKTGQLNNQDHLVNSRRGTAGVVRCLVSVRSRVSS